MKLDGLLQAYGFRTFQMILIVSCTSKKKKKKKQIQFSSAANLEKYEWFWKPYKMVYEKINCWLNRLRKNLSMKPVKHAINSWLFFPRKVKLLLTIYVGVWVALVDFNSAKTQRALFVFTINSAWQNYALILASSWLLNYQYEEKLLTFWFQEEIKKILCLISILKIQTIFVSDPFFIYM